MFNDSSLLKFLENFYNRWIHKLIPEKEDDYVFEIQSPKKRNYFLIFLKILPYIALIEFLVSIFIDPFENVVLHFPWRESGTPLSGVLRMLSVTGLVGYATNYIAIKMLFHPRNKRPLLGQGLIPASKIKIAYKLGESISREIINHELIAKEIRSSGIFRKYFDNFNHTFEEILHTKEFQDDLIQLIEKIFNEILHSEEFKKNVRNFVKSIDFDNLTGLESGILKIYKWLGGDKDIAKKVEELLLSMQINLDENRETILQYTYAIPEHLYKNREFIENAFINIISFLIDRINIKKVMIQNLLALDELRLEKLLLYSTSEQLEYIQYLGCLLGILGGLFIWLPFESFVLFLVVGILLFLIDESLYRIQKK
ncbi:MAG: DUF445 domain-containing protein [Leptonema sp. (in: bacteria)]